MSSDSEKNQQKLKPEEKPAPPKNQPAPKPAAKKQKKNQLELPAFEKGISDKLVKSLAIKHQVDFVKEDRVGIKTSKENVHDVAQFIRDDLNYDHVESVSGVDYPADKEIEVVYHLGSSYTDPHCKTSSYLGYKSSKRRNPIPGNDATKLPSLRDIFYSVEFHEREVFEMLGVYFEGHPDNRRLLLPEDWADLPPLRKDFAIKGDRQ